jgi:hypothetical protein
VKSVTVRHTPLTAMLQPCVRRCTHGHGGIKDRSGSAISSLKHGGQDRHMCMGVVVGRLTSYAPSSTTDASLMVSSIPAGDGSDDFQSSNYAL